MVSTSGTSHSYYYGSRRRDGVVSVLVTTLASHLRRPLRFLHKVPATWFLLLALQGFWMLCDRYWKFQIVLTLPRPYIAPTESSPLSPFYDPPYNSYDGPTRVFPPRSSFPCLPLRSQTQFFSNPNPAANIVVPPLQSGFLLLMQPQVASTTLASITSRIARNVAQRRQKENADSAASSSSRIQTHHQTNTNETVACAAWAAVIKAKRLQFRNRTESFLWTMVREPVDRLVSQFFHRTAAVQGREGTMIANFKSFLEGTTSKTANREYGMYMKTLTLRPHVSPQRTDWYPRYTSEILSAFDFIGVQERWDESLVVLQLLLGLETQDILYLKTRSSTAFGGASFEPMYNKASDDWSQKCVKLLPKHIDLEWKQYLHQPFMFEELFEPDVYFYKAVNASLDATIASLGPDRVHLGVQRLQFAQRKVEEARCANSAVYPCSAEGQRQTTVDCIGSDVGCGSQCLDSVGRALSTNTAFLALS